jgi:hypothetical protein
MEKKRQLLFFLALFSCYLVLSLTFVSAYQVGDAFGAGSKSRHARFAAETFMEPALKIADDLKPLACDSSGLIKFRAYVENVAEFDIVGSEAQIEDAQNGRQYNVTSALSCTPVTRLISNQEIACSLNVKELLYRLSYSSSCPLDKTENDISISFDISYNENTATVTDSKGLVITKAGVRPELEINFDVSHPPYPVPEINCNTGSEIDVPVVIHNAETLFGDIAWSFSANGTSSSMIECGKIHSWTEEGRDDVYLCGLTVPSTMFQTCEAGGEALVIINAEAGDYKLSDNFSATLFSDELSLSLRLSSLATFSCQIIDEDGTCIPKEPQQNVTATITGNVPEKLKLFESRYSLGGGDLTTMWCKKLSSSKYECSVFITLDKLGQSNKSETKSKDRDLAVFFDVKYLNYYTNISASTKVTLEGKVINDVLNTLSVLKQKKAFLEWLANSKFEKALKTAIRVIDIINICCVGFALIDQLMTKAATEGGKQALSTVVIEAVKKAFIGSATSALGKIMTIVQTVGPNIFACVAQKGIEDISNEIRNLQKFENKTISPDVLKIPTMGETVERHMAGCTAKAFWNTLKNALWGLLCTFVLVLVTIFTAGAAYAPIMTVCKAMTSPAVQYIRLALNLLIIVIEILMLFNVVATATQAMTLARERMNVQMNATNIMADYQGAFSQTLESMVTSMAVNDMLMNLTYATYGMGTVKLMFNSSRTGVLGEGDDICSGDMITIGYDLEKLNLTKDFISELFITNSHSRVLLFDKLKGTYGPSETDALLGTDPAKDRPEEYTFRLEYENKKLDYKLNYINHTCASVTR